MEYAVGELSWGIVVFLRFWNASVAARVLTIYLVTVLTNQVCRIRTTEFEVLVSA